MEKNKTRVPDYLERDYKSAVNFTKNNKMMRYSFQKKRSLRGKLNNIFVNIRKRQNFRKNGKLSKIPERERLGDERIKKERTFVIKPASPISAANITRLTILAAAFIFLFFMCSYDGCGVFPLIENSFVSLLPKFVIIIFMFFVVKLITSSIKIVLSKRRDKEEHFKFGGALSLIRYGLWIIFILIAATLFFGNIGGILTSLGLIGFGITFALQKPIMNFVGWASINFHGTFEVGDRIKIGEFSGDVVEIKMMHTIIRSLLTQTDHHSGKLVAIPNELMLVQPVENYTRDNNFIKTELKISVTYESDWRKAKNAFEDIVTDVTKRNIHKFRNNLTKKISVIDSTIDKLSKRFERAKTKSRENKLKEQIAVLENEKKNIEETFEIVPEQFRPQVHVDMGDSSIILSALYLSPYDMVRTVKTEVNSRFLDFAKREKTVEIAYPHVHLVTKERPPMNNNNLSKFLGIEQLEPGK